MGKDPAEGLRHELGEIWQECRNLGQSVSALKAQVAILLWVLGVVVVAVIGVVVKVLTKG